MSQVGTKTTGGWGRRLPECLHRSNFFEAGFRIRRADLGLGLARPQGFGAGLVEKGGAQWRNYLLASVFTFAEFLCRLVVMHEQSKERWMELCEQASKEQDPAKLLSLVEEINRLLEQRDLKIKTRDLPRAD